MQPRVFVVTGAASGMGRAAATRWARRGALVAAVDRSAEALKELEAAEPNISAFECDVSDEEAVERVRSEICSRLGDIDRLVNAAGILLRGEAGELSTPDVRRTIEINCLGTMFWVNAVLPAMRERRRGEIVNFASVAGFLPTPGVNAYVTSKFAVLGFTETLAEEVRRDGIRVVAVCPPPVDTPMLAEVMDGTFGPRIEKYMKPITPDVVIDAIDKALPGRRLLVLPGPGTPAMLWLRRLSPGLTRFLFRALVYRQPSTRGR
jgi:NAD(P)-dependent dehydrogenase (short-subunit alcohol dehydrogenase family)